MSEMPKTTPRRTILHMDMDAFYASVEVLDDPSLKAKPLIIGALPTERGIVATCSYEARKFGVHSGQSIKEAYRLCPEGIYMHGHHKRYQQISDQVHRILMDYTDQIEFVALDEGYLDITASLKLFGGAKAIGEAIRKRVFETTGLTCSVGIGYNKMTAKMASEEKKPNGFFVFEDPVFFECYMKDRSLRAIPGIGGKTEEFLKGYHLETFSDLWKWSEPSLVRLLGQSGHELYLRCRGIASDYVKKLGEGEAKSYGKEVTYQQDMLDKEEMLSTLKLLSRSVSLGLQRRLLWASTITLKIKYNDLKLHTRSITLTNPIRQSQELYQTVLTLLNKAPLEKPVRLLGISTSAFTDNPIRQLSLESEQDEKSKRREELSRSLMGLYDRFGSGIVQTAGELESQKLLKEHGLDQ